MLDTELKMELESKLVEYRSILDAFNEMNIALSKHYISGFEQILTSFKSVKENAVEHNRKYSCNFNPLHEFVKLNETMHSKMLAYLLNPVAGHGQKDLFLQDFLKFIGIANPELGQWIVTAEKDRVDIMLKRREPNSVVLIENKSNGAIDQPNQLYRYWHKEMYRNPEYSKEKVNYYKIIYLPGDESKIPCESSLRKPDNCLGYDVFVLEEEHKKLPEEIPLKYDYLTFETDIANVLRDCMKKLPEENHRLREFILQYLEIWN